MDISDKNLKLFKVVLKIAWTLAGLFFIWYDIAIFHNTEIYPSAWLVFGALCFFGGLTGLVGGVGGALLAQGLLTYKANTSAVLGKLVFAQDFSMFDKVAHAIFIFYGAYLIYRQIRKNVRVRREKIN